MFPYKSKNRAYKKRYTWVDSVGLQLCKVGGELGVANRT